MNLTGQCKTDFEKWYLDVFADEDYLYDFYKNQHPSEKYGVYVDLFDSVGIYVMNLNNEISRKFYYYISTKPMSNDITSECNLTRPEARTKAIEKANEIYN